MKVQINDLVEFKLLDRMITGMVVSLDKINNKVTVACIETNIGYKTSMDSLAIIKKFNCTLNIIKQDIWKDFDKLDYVCITTNALLNRQGQLIMGKGNALQAARRDRNLATVLGNQLKEKRAVGQFYGLLAYGKYIAFQTKYDWRDNSPIELITRSVEKLTKLANKYPDRTFGLPYPGVNNGNLSKNDVYPLIRKLPPNVTVYYL